MSGVDVIQDKEPWVCPFCMKEEVFLYKAAKPYPVNQGKGIGQTEDKIVMYDYYSKCGNCDACFS